MDVSPKFKKLPLLPIFRRQYSLYLNLRTGHIAPKPFLMASLFKILDVSLHNGRFYPIQIIAFIVDISPTIVLNYALDISPSTKHIAPEPF